MRESGSIEQDADVVMFVYREEYYLEKKEPKLGSIEHAEWQSKMNEILGSADIIIGKQRHGPTGNVKVEFEAIYTKFKDLKKLINYNFKFFSLKLYLIIVILNKLYKNLIITKPKFTLSITFDIAFNFWILTKNFQLRCFIGYFAARE